MKETVNVQREGLKKHKVVIWEGEKTANEGIQNRNAWMTRERNKGKSYGTNYIFGAHYVKHIRSCARRKKFRKHTMTGGVVGGDATWGRRGSTLWGGSRRGWREAAFRWLRLRMHVHKGGAPWNRISTWRGNAGSVQLPNERENLIRVRWGAPSAQPPAESAARHPLLPPSELRPAHEPCN